MLGGKPSKVCSSTSQPVFLPRSGDGEVRAARVKHRTFCTLQIAQIIELLAESRDAASLDPRMVS